MSRRPAARAAAALVAALALVILACGEGGSPEATATPTASSVAGPGSAPDAPTAPPSGAPGSAATPDVSVPPLLNEAAIAAWAADTCAVLEQWTRAFEEAEAAEAVTGGPASLALAERRARSARLSVSEIESSTVAATALRASVAPFEVAEYHDLLAAQFEGRVAAVEALEARLDQVEDIAGLEAAGDEYKAALEQRRRVLTAASQFLPPEAVAGLTGGGPCGYLTR